MGSTGRQSQMMDLVVPDLEDPVSLESLRRKIVKFSLNGKKYDKERQVELAKHTRVRIHEGFIPDAYHWCEDRFGDNWTWSNPLQTDYVDMYFIHTEDALLFKLRFTPLDT